MRGLYSAPFAVAQVDGPTLTAAAAATMLPAHLSGLILPTNFYEQIGQVWRIHASGRISCVVTTPGTARFDIRVGGNVVFDTLAINLNTTAKTTVGWVLDVEMTLRAVGSSANFFGQGTWQSEAVIGSPAVTAGGNGSVLVPYNTAPTVGGNFNSTLANAFDAFFTQTVATGSMTLHEFIAECVN